MKPYFRKLSSILHLAHDLFDVIISNPQNLDVLTYDSASSKWKNRANAGGSIEVKEADGAPDVTGVSLVIVTNGKLTDNGGGSVSLDLSGADANAVHVNASSEISGITEKTTPVSNDLLIIEDSASSNAKKKLKIGNLPFSAYSADPYRFGIGYILSDALASLNAGNGLGTWSIDGTLHALSATGSNNWANVVFFLKSKAGLGRYLYAQGMVRTSATGGYSGFIFNTESGILQFIQFRSGDNTIKIGEVSSNWASASAAFTFSANTWYDWKLLIEGARYRIKIWADGGAEPTWTLDWTADSTGHSAGLDAFAFNIYANTWYFKNLIITAGGSVRWSGLAAGQKVEVYNSSDTLIATYTLGTAETVAWLDLTGTTLPITKGYFKIYDTDGTTLLKTTSAYPEIWAGDDYWWNSTV